MELHCEQRGAGEPLLLLHGMTGAGGDFAHLFDLDALAAGHRLLIPDLRGHGRSSDPDGSFSHRQCARDLLALLDRAGLARVKALGVSLGGNTLLHVATMQPERIAAMVTVGSPAYFPAQARSVMHASGTAGPSPEERRLLRGKHPGGDVQIDGLYQYIRGFADRHDDMSFTPPLLSTIRARTLLVTGDRDPLYPVEIFVDMYRAIPECQLWVMPGAGHADVYGRWRASFADVALAFLASR